MSVAHLITLLLCVSFTFGSKYELLQYNPVANPKAVVTQGNVRFTVLTDHLVRIEYSQSGSFEDRGTVAFLNRYLDVPQFETKTNNGTLSITTSGLRIDYTIGSTFSPSSLIITSLDATSAFKKWNYGMPDTGNLLGTIRTLDGLSVVPLNCTQLNSQVSNTHCEWGVISRDGWAVVDDSSNWALNSDNDWWEEVNTDDKDLYFFGHGHDYKKALFDFTQVSGKIAMVPRYASGIWWSIWYNLANVGVRQIVDHYHQLSIPLDVYVLDMDWHTKQDWTGCYEVRLFPYPSATLNWLKNKGLAITANLHDADGVMTHEDMYKEMATAMGFNPTTHGNIAFDVVNRTYVDSLEDIVLGSLEKQGMDFWWIDWQQGDKKGGCAGGKQNPTIALSRARCTDHIRRGEKTRGIALARFGGLGAQRYQVGFSGDVQIVGWKDFAFQPYFSMTASNVGFGFWSHDIVGPADDHELHTRWIQWGAYSGVFRTHDRGMSAGGCANNDPSSCGIVAIWELPPKYFEPMRSAMSARVSMVPYLYNATRTAYDTGISLIKPMYYDFPEFNLAYAADPTGKFGQYMIGEQMMVAPVLVPMLKNNSLAPTQIWIPPGQWLETNTGVLYTGASDGSTVLGKSWDLSEVPVFMKAGSIFPRIPIETGNTLGRAMDQYDSLIFEIYPGSESGSTVVYEDDAATTDYLNGKSGWTKFEYVRKEGSIEITITPATGFSEVPTSRRYEICLINGLPIISGTVNGSPVHYDRLLYQSLTYIGSNGGDNTWHYSGDTLTTHIESTSISGTVTIQLTTDIMSDAALSGLKGIIQHAIMSKQNMDATRVTPGAHSTSGGDISILASSGEALTYLSGNNTNEFMSIISKIPDLFSKAVVEVEAMKGKMNADRWGYSIDLLKNV